MRHFQVVELVSRDLYGKMKENAIEVISPLALAALDNLADYFGVKVIVNNWHAGGPFQHRGARTIAEEQAINPGHGHSRHVFGLPDRPLSDAFDFDVIGRTAQQVRQRIIADKDNPLLCTITRLEDKVLWVHMDLMPLPPGTPRIHVFEP